MKILVGTTKGAFLICGDQNRTGWKVNGPYCDGWPINHVIADPVAGSLWAGGGGDMHGAGVWRSADVGETWEVTRLTTGMMDEWAANDPGFAAIINWQDEPLPFTDEFSQIWSLGFAHDTLYAGTKPASLLASHDSGNTWQDLRTGLPQESCFYTVLRQAMARDERDPVSLYFGTNTGSVFSSSDEGDTWHEIARHLPTILSVEGLDA